jgi:hypothetical protein
MVRRGVGALVAAVAALCATGSLRAETPACDASSLKGAFGYRLSGFVYDTRGYMYILGAAGRMVSDGGGSVTGADTYSFDGTIVKRQYTGSYTVNADCTGSLTVTDSSGSGGSFDFVIVAGGAEVEVVETDSGYALTGTLKQQAAAVQAAAPSAPVQ